ncbi:all-trans retinoic acid-induced differentiation factor isoform X2 [Chrysemys picta bellii]|uniref:all-trans retinoic acid-induced differentiation factor isoform X2 n=1 Tax=Chrysemys picta bellii TaxID=8478 RepID=UPI0032B12A3A
MGPRAWVLPLLLGLAAWRGGAAGRSAVCSRCPGPVRSVSSVASYCASRPALALQGRCCLSGEPEPVIVGLDLGNCSLTFLGAGFPDASAAVVIDLTENPLENISNTSFQGFTRLQSILAVPRELPVQPRRPRACPVPVLRELPRLQVSARGHLSPAVLLWDPGSRDDHPVPAGLGQPAPESQDLLNPSCRTGKGRRPGWGACVGASPQPLNSPWCRVRAA